MIESFVNYEEIDKQAKKELEDENFRKAVDKRKEELKYYRPWYIRIFPWRLKIVKV